MLLLSTQDSRSCWSISHTAIARPLILYTDEPLDHLGTVLCKRKSDHLRLYGTSGYHFALPSPTFNILNCVY
jgi:hypothetical protein